MAEILPQPKPMLTIGDGTGNGAVFVPKPDAKLEIDGQPLTKFQIKSFDKEKIAPGVEDARLAKKVTNKDGTIVYKELAYDMGGTVRQEDVSGILVRQQDGTDAFYDISKFDVFNVNEDITPTPEPTLITPLTHLETRAKEPPTSISLIGLDVDQMIQAQAGKDMEKINAEGGGFFKKLVRGIWKGDIAHELLEEHAYQFRKKQVDAAHMMLSDETFTLIQTRAEQAYDADMAQLQKDNKLAYAWTKFKDAIAANFGGYTSKEIYAITLAGEMSAHDQLSNIEQYEQSLAAVRSRFEQDFLDRDGVIRKNLGEHLDILKFNDPQTAAEHKEIVDGIKELVHKYVNGEFTSKQDLETAMADFAKTHGIGADAKTAREAQLYASSLYQIANESKARFESEKSFAGIDAQLDAMEVRIGRAQMGESTQFQQSDTEKVVTWLASKNLIGTLFANESVAGTATAVALTLGYLPRYVASQVARTAYGAAGGGIVAGTISGLKENARMKHEWFQYMRQRETGGGQAEPGDKLREWMAAREIKQISVNDLISRMTNESDLNKSLAYLADAKARRAISARGGENVSLIQWGPSTDVGRANLDLSIDKLERDLQIKFGQNISDRLKILTDAQTNVLVQGRFTANLDDPLKIALDAVKDNDIGVQKFRRSLGLWGAAATTGEAQGLDAALKDVKAQIRVEAARRGIESAVIGTAIGTIMTDVPYVIAHHADVLQNIQHVLHIPVTQIGPEVQVNMRSVVLPNLTYQGHPIDVSIPANTNLAIDAAHHSYTLLDANNHVLASGIKIDATGAIKNTTQLNALPDIKANGIHFGNNTPYQVRSPGGFNSVPKLVTEHLQDNSVMNLHSADWPKDGSGFWGWAQQKISGQHYNNDPTSALDSVKNVFRSYEKNFQMDPSGHAMNVTGVTNIPYHATPGTPMGGNEIWYNAIGNHADFNNVPNSLFSDKSMLAIAKATDDAVTMYKNHAPMDQLHQILIKGYFGQEKDIFTKDDLTVLMNYFGGSDVTHTVMQTIAKPDIVTTLYHGAITQSVHLTKSVIPPFRPVITNVPAVVPLPREGMRPGKATNLPYEQFFTPKLPEKRPRELYTSGAALPELQAWIKENPNRLHPYLKIIAADGSEQWVDTDGKPITRDSNRERDTINTYLEDIKTNDPGYFTYLTTLSQESTMPPMKDDCRVSVNIPAWMEGKIIHNTLKEYTRQTDQSGNPLNPDSYEINILVNRKTGAPPDNTVQEIQRFIDESKAEGKNFTINYLDVEFNPPKNNVGNSRKVITDLTLLRSNRRTGATGQLYIETEDADLLRVDPHTVTNLITKLDTNPHLDAVSGIQDRDPEILMQNDYLFLDRRMWDFIGTMLQRREKYRPENNPNWNNWWNRTITGGWNTGYTAESYALIGGYNSGLIMGEDTVIGEKISMIRGDGQKPNLDVVGTVPSRSDSSPRRFINEVITGKGAYSDTFGDEELNLRLKKASLDELLTMISPVARITPENEGTFKNMIAWRLDQLKDLSVNETEAIKDFKLAMTFLGFKKGDYEITPDGKVNIMSLDTIKQTLEDYRERHQTPRQPGKRTKYETPAPQA